MEIGICTRHIDLTEAGQQFYEEDRFTDIVAEGIDVAIRIGFLRDSVATRITSVPRVFCASPNYLARHGEPKKPADLTKHDCLHYILLSTGVEWGLLPGDEARDIEII